MPARTSRRCTISDLPMARTAQKNLAAMVEPLPQGLLEETTRGTTPSASRFIFIRKPALELGELKSCSIIISGSTVRARAR